MFKRILVPVDGSEASESGLREALDLARSSGAQLRAVNVVDERMIPAATPVPFGSNAELVASLKSAGKAALEAAAAAAASKRVQGDCVQRRSAERDVSDVILAEADKWKADVIVMGTHGRRGLNRLLMGSDAQRVLRDARVPVLLVKAGGDDATSLEAAV